MITSSSSLISRPLSFCHDLNMSFRSVSTRSGKITFVPDNVQPVAPTVAAAPHVPAHVPSYNEYRPNPNPVLGEPMSLHDLYPLDNPPFFLNLTCDSLTNITENSFDFLRNGVMTGGLRGIVLKKLEEFVELRKFFLDLRSDYFRAHDLVLPTHGRILIPGPTMPGWIQNESISNLSLERSLSSEFEVIEETSTGAIRPKTRGFIVQSIREDFAITEWATFFISFLDPCFLGIIKSLLVFYSFCKFINKMFHFIDKFKSFFIFDQIDQNLMIGIFSIKNTRGWIFLIEKIKCVFMTFPYRIRYVLRS